MSGKTAELPRDRVPESTSSATTSPAVPSKTLRKRPVSTSEALQQRIMEDNRPEQSSTADEDGAAIAPGSWASKNQWVVFAVASGACAAFNGVFAKL